MRDIKFRAWDKSSKVMMHNVGFHPWIAEAHEDNTFTVTPAIDRWELMQYTGLKDKHGKEIYEGDIIQISVDEPFQMTHGKWSRKEIVYRNGVWIASYISSEKGKLPRGYVAGELTAFRDYNGKEAVFTDSEEYQKLNVEIIGNIYENPELLSAGIGGDKNG